MKKGPIHRVWILFLLLGALGAAMPIPSSEIAVAQESVEDASGQKAEADLLFQKGLQAFETSQFGAALDSWQRALALYRAIGDREGEANSLGNLGNAYRNLGQYSKAIDFHTQSLEIKWEIGNRQGEAASLGNLGNAYENLGQYNKAIEFYTQSLDLDREIGHRQGEAASLGNLGNAYYRLGQYNKAIDFHTQSLEIKREIGNRLGEANSLGNLGLAYDNLGQYDKAIELLTQALYIAREIGYRQGEANALGNLGNAYDNLGQSNKAIEFFTQHRDIARKIGDRQGEANSLGSLGLAYHSLGQYRKAIDFHKQHRDIAQSLGDQLGVATSLNNLGLAYLNLMNYPQAEKHYIQSIETWESLRHNLETDERISIFETQAHSYLILQRILMAQKKTEQALEIAERGRARALINQLHALSPEKEQPVPTHPAIDEIKQIARDQQATLVEYTLINNELLFIWVVKPDGNVHSEIVNPKLLGQGLEDLDKQTRNWLELARGADDADTLIPALLKQSQIGDNANSRSNKNANSDPDTQHTLLQTLHSFLIEPIEEHLPQNPEEKVIIIPHRSLFRVPFPALLENKAENPQYLIDKHTLITVPSIHALSYAKQQPQGQPQSFLIAGNPTLPHDADPKHFIPLKGAQVEAEAIAALFKTQAFIGDNATESLIRQELGKADIIHLAAHGKFEATTPLQEQQTDAADPKTAESQENPVRPGSYIVLADGDGPNKDGEDGYLDTAELVALTTQQKLQAQLVVLSACETGLGDITGDGVVGLSRALTAAGVPSIVVSLWSVGDTSTAKLMKAFYTNVYVEGMDKAKGLRAAMLTVRKEYPDPGHWAAFTLIGQAE